MMSILKNRAVWQAALLAELIVVPIGLGVLFYLLVQALPLIELRHTAGVVVASAGLAVLGYALLALRLSCVLTAFGITLADASAWRVHLGSLFYYFFLPAGVGYDFSKFAKIAVRSPRHGPRRVTAVVVAERIAGGAGVYLLLLATLPFARLAETSRLAWLAPSAWAWPALVGAVPLAWWLIVRGARRWGYRPAPLLPAVLVSTAAYLAVAAAVWFVAGSLGIAVSLPEIVVVLAATLLLQLVPVNLLGVTLGEVASITLYLAYGLARPEALLLTAVAYSHRLVCAMVGGAFESAGAWRAVRSHGVGTAPWAAVAAARRRLAARRLQ